MITYDLLWYFTFGGFVLGFILGIVFMKKDTNED